MDPSPRVHSIASDQNLADTTPVPHTTTTLGKRQHTHTAYANPAGALSQPSVAPLQAGIRELTWLVEEIRASPPTAPVDCMMDYGQSEPETYTMGTE
eukprot:3394411-Rhodomonas_salina.1